MLDLRLAVSERVYGDGPVKVRCPAHNDVAASLAVYRDNIHCFGCGFHRSDPDDALATLLGTTVVEARTILDKFQVEGVPRAAGKAPRDPLPLAYAQMYHRYLLESRTERLAWLFGRGLTLKTVCDNLLGHTGTHFTIPVLDREHRLLTVRFRKDDVAVPNEYEMWNGDVVKVPKYTGWTGRNGVYLYGEHWLEGAETAWICEGELDALRLRQSGFAACSLTNGARQASRAPVILSRLFPTITSLVVCTDTDGPGEAAAVQVVQEAHALGMKTYRAWWFGDYKDVTEALQAGEQIGERRVYAI